MNLEDEYTTLLTEYRELTKRYAEHIEKMSTMKEVLDPPYLWAGDYKSVLNNGKGIPLVDELRELLSGTFIVKLKLTNIRSNLYVNGKACLTRKAKNSPIQVSSNVKVLEGEPAMSGGSNSYPHISFKEGYCVVEVTTHGFPHLDLKSYDLNVEILEIEKENR